MLPMLEYYRVTIVGSIPVNHSMDYAAMRSATEGYEDLRYTD